MNGAVSHEPTDPAEEIRAHLHELLKSPHFRGSKRCQNLLAFLIEKTIEGRQELLKERVIGTEVFSRASGYDPAGDPVVRVTAAEVRKRLAQFYQENPDRGPRAPCFRIATGGYVPEIYSLATVEPEIPAGPGRAGKWRLLAALGILAIAITTTAVLWGLRTPSTAVERFWGPAFHSRRAPVIVMEHYGAGGFVDRLNAELDVKGRAEKTNPEKTNLVVSDIAATFGQATMLGNLYAIRDLDRVFATKNLAPELRVGAELYTSDLAERSVILLGYFNNPWAKDLNSDHLPFTFFDERTPAGAVHGIRDNLHPGKSWTLTSDRGWFTNSAVSYAVVTRLLQPEPVRFLLSISGLTHLGTQAASDFITGESYLKELELQAPHAWDRKNLQLVLETHIVNQTPTPPIIVACHFW